MTEGVIESVALTLGTAVRPNQPLLDIRVDYSGGVARDCPPIAFFRIIAREKGCIREIGCKRGDRVLVGACLALLTTDPNDAMDRPADRGLRTTVVGVLHNPDWSSFGE
jgi:pyruvate/2-oxoglutarate dehydrogenase complex dihydrolipoamide acyltransferase (E2) component